MNKRQKKKKNIIKKVKTCPIKNKELHSTTTEECHYIRYNYTITKCQLCGGLKGDT